MIEKLELPFITAILKMPLNIKKMKWEEYLVCKIVHTFRECIYSIFSMSFYFIEIKKNQIQETSNTLPCLVVGALSSHTLQLASPAGNSSV
jgi:hypothetical protein